MAFFNRKKSQSISDLEDYYANRNNSTGRAWAMALLSLLVTISVLTVLFFGVRWIYRSLTDNKTTVVTTTTQPANTNDTNIQVVDPTPATMSEQSSQDHTSHTTPTPASEPAGQVSDQAARTTTPSTASRTQGTSTTPRTGDSENLPNTGTSDTIFVLPFITAVIGYFVARKHFINE
jgi:cytoskeletal protein RodZ